MAEQLMAWHRRIDESNEAYDAFKLYMEMGTKRKGRLVAEELGKNLSLIQRWSVEYDWKNRVRAYDTAMSETTFHARKDQVAKLQEVVVTAAAGDYHNLMNMWHEMLLSDEMSSGDIDDQVSRLEKLVKLRSEIDKLGRRAAELPTTYKSIERSEGKPVKPERRELTWAAGPTVIEGHKVEGENVTEHTTSRINRLTAPAQEPTED